MRKPLVLLLTSISLFSLTGCVKGIKVVSDHTTGIMVVSNNKPYEIYYSCKKCDGTIIYKIDVNENYSTDLKANVNVDSGAFSMKITNEEGLELYNDSLTSSLEFVVPLAQYGSYRLELGHDAFKGSYRLNWNK